MVFAITKKDIIRAFFGLLAAFLFVTGIISVFKTVDSIIRTLRFSEFSKSEYFIVYFPSFLRLIIAFINLAALVLFVIFLFRSTDKNKKLISVALVLKAVCALLYSIIYIASYFSTTSLNLLDNPVLTYLVIMLGLSISFLPSAVFSLILAIKIKAQSINIKTVSAVAIICGLLPVIFNFIFYLFLGEPFNIIYSDVSFIQMLELIIIPLLILVCSPMFVVSKYKPSEALRLQ